MVVRLWRPEGRILRGKKVRRRKYSQVDPTPKQMKAWVRLHQVAPQWAPIYHEEAV